MTRVVYLAAGYGVMLLAVMVGLFLVAWCDRSLAKGAFALTLVGGFHKGCNPAAFAHGSRRGPTGRRVEFRSSDTL